MKTWIKSAVFFCLYYSGLEWLLARLIPFDAVAILMYHGVCDEAPIPPEINFHVERDVFERQMRALKSRYPVYPLDELSATLARGDRPKKGIVLTFDDGYTNNLSAAAPVLKQLGMPFTVFLATAYVGTKNWIPLNEVYWKWSQGELTSEEMAEIRFQLRNRPSKEIPEILDRARVHPGTAPTAALDSFAMLSWDDVREMTKAGADFGSHTHTHCNMAVESEPQQKVEVGTSNQLIEKNLGKRVKSFAYPYGYTSEISRSVVMQAGYDCALSTQYGLVTDYTDRFGLPRIGYDRRIWMFTGEILYQFVKQSAKSRWQSVFGTNPERGAFAEATKERHV